MSRLACLALGLSAFALTACSPGAGDNIVGSWVSESGYVDTLCQTLTGTGNAAEVAINPGDKGIVVAKADGILSFSHSDFPSCTFLAEARGADTAEIRQIAACVDDNGTKVTLVSGTLLRQGDNLDALLNFTTQKPDEEGRNTSCSNDQNITF